MSWIRYSRRSSPSCPVSFWPPMKGGLLTMALKPPRRITSGNSRAQWRGRMGSGRGPRSQASSLARNACSSGDSISPSMIRWACSDRPVSRSSKASADWPAVESAAAATASAMSRSRSVRRSASASFAASAWAWRGSRTGSASISSRSSRTRVRIGPTTSSIAPDSRALIRRPVSGSRWNASIWDSEIRPTRESPQRRAWSEEGERLTLGQGDQPEGQFAEFDGGFVAVHAVQAARRYPPPWPPGPRRPGRNRGRGRPVPASG